LIPLPPLLAGIAALAGAPAEPAGQLIFPPRSLHSHGSCVVECPNGDLLACWYSGSGERTADDVKVLGARLRRGESRWSEPFLMADTPGFPDCNPCMIIDSSRRLWLLWPVIQSNQWESALMKFRTSRDFQRPGPPRWEGERVMHLKPGTEFLQAVQRDLAPRWAPALEAASEADKARIREYLADRTRRAGDKLSQRLGWMTRAHPFLLGTRLAVPLYSDLFDFSLFAFTDDAGETWSVSEPIVGPGCVQPSVARRRDGTLVAFFRDNGPPPNRVITSESTDNGRTWSPPRDIDLPNPGSALEAAVLRSGRWLLICNDTERGRHSLAVFLSEDEGRTWPIVRHLERDEPGTGAGSYHYPSVIQARDGALHATYSITIPARDHDRLGRGESIKHTRFTEEWVLAGGRRP